MPSSTTRKTSWTEQHVGDRSGRLVVVVTGVNSGIAPSRPASSSDGVH